MARITDKGGRIDGNSAFTRLFGNEGLGLLFSRVHAAVIRSGYELESVLSEFMERRGQVRSLAETCEAIHSGHVMTWPQATVSFKGRGIVRSLAYEGHADLVIFNHRKSTGLVVEIKDGDSFDTKKSAGERESLVAFSKWLAVKTNYAVSHALCCFNQEDPWEIVRGLKGWFDRSEVMSGRNLCQVLGLDYEEVLRVRKIHQRSNMGELAVQLLQIPEMRSLLIQAIEQESWRAGQGVLLISDLDALLPKVSQEE